MPCVGVKKTFLLPFVVTNSMSFCDSLRYPVKLLLTRVSEGYEPGVWLPYIIVTDNTSYIVDIYLLYAVIKFACNYIYILHNKNDLNIF